jgi:hypothetical protein
LIGGIDMKEYNMMGKDIGIVIKANSAVEAMEKAESELLQGWSGYVVFLDEEDEEEYKSEQ